MSKRKGHPHEWCAPKRVEWLPLVDALRHQFAGPSKEMMDTIVISQSQVKDGFLATGQL
jgi:hypothetical protein